MFTKINVIDLDNLWHIKISQISKAIISWDNFINKINKKQEAIALWQLVDGSSINKVCFLSIKDCKCNVNGSTGCSPSGTCICKEKYGGSQCQQCRLNSLFKPLPIFWFYALILVDCFYARSLFKEILCFWNMFFLISELENSSFSLGYFKHATFPDWFGIPESQNSFLVPLDHVTSFTKNFFIFIFDINSNSKTFFIFFLGYLITLLVLFLIA